MKILRKILIIVFVVICLIIGLVLSACHIWNWMYEIEEAKYYRNKDNFVSVTAVCVQITTNEYFPGQYFVVVDEMEYNKTDDHNSWFISRSFCINKVNSLILKEAGMEEKLTPGKTFTFISAPRYFGDGYQCPIVGLEIDGEVLLDFETGYKNLMASY